MGLEELSTIRTYLLDYLRTHATTEEEFDCIMRMMRDVNRKERHALVEAGVLIRLTIDDIERIREQRRHKP